MADPYVRQIGFVEDIDGMEHEVAQAADDRAQRVAEYSDDDIPADYDGAPVYGYVSDPAETSGPDGI